MSDQPPNLAPALVSSDTQFSEGLAQNGYVILPENFLTRAELQQLSRDFAELWEQGKFQTAGVGKDQNRRLSNDIRRDEICWFEPSQFLPGQALFWQKLMALKDSLNRELYLGLWDMEGHFAHYPPGGFYRRHIDRFSNNDARTVSLVFYLNENWKQGDGGELVIHPSSESSAIVVEPRLGTLVMFMSEQIEHEVLESKAPRRSFAGWFRRRMN